MSVDIHQRGDGSLGMAGPSGGTANSGFCTTSAEYAAASIDKAFFVADRAYVVTGVRGFVAVAGTDAGAATAILRKVPTGIALASGTALHSGTFNLKGTAVTPQTLTLSTTLSDIQIAAGDAIAIDFTGVLTSATGAVTVTLAPA